MASPLPPHFLSAGDRRFAYVEKSNPGTTHLQWLTYGVYELSGEVCSAPLAHAGEECLLFCWHGEVTVDLAGGHYTLEHYDVLYVPRGESYRLQNLAGESKVIVCRATAENRHPPFHARWKDFSHDERADPASEGQGCFRDVRRGRGLRQTHCRLYALPTVATVYPPHNHTDQEEVYIFTAGHGAMEVYVDEETKCFVRAVQTGDAVTIPIGNYHPVFSQEDPLEFIWCIAGARYWVGDKNKDFMTAKVASLTT